MASIPERVYKRVLFNTDRQEPSGCLISRYSEGSHRYAQIGWKEGGKNITTLCHLVVWRWINGNVPKGMTVDHRCHQRKCVEIKHLRLLTNEANAADNGQVRSNPDSDRRCGKGHLMAITGGKLHYCRECRNAARRERRRRGLTN